MRQSSKKKCFREDRQKGTQGRRDEAVRCFMNHSFGTMSLTMAEGRDSTQHSYYRYSPRRNSLRATPTSVRIPQLPDVIITHPPQPRGRDLSAQHCTDTRLVGQYTGVRLDSTNAKRKKKLFQHRESAIINRTGADYISTRVHIAYPRAATRPLTTATCTARRHHPDNPPTLLDPALRPHD